MLIQIVGLIYLIRKTNFKCKEGNIRSFKYIFGVVLIYILITIIFTLLLGLFISNGNISPDAATFPMSIIASAVSVLIAGAISNLVINKIPLPEVNEEEELSDDDIILDN